MEQEKAGRLAGTCELCLGQKRSCKRQLWEQLNPRTRGMIARALALQQTRAQLPEPLRARFSAVISEIDRMGTQSLALPAEVARRTPPGA